MYTLHIAGRPFDINSIGLPLVKNTLLLGRLDFMIKVDSAESNRLIEHYNNLDNIQNEICVFVSLDGQKGIVCKNLRLNKLDDTRLRVQAMGI